MEGLWFKRKRYGWGWYPASWQGWAVTAAYIAGVIFFASAVGPHAPTEEWFFLFFLPIVLLSIAFIRIAYRKGESPRWQWGEKNEMK